MFRPICPTNAFNWFILNSEVHINSKQNPLFKPQGYTVPVRLILIRYKFLVIVSLLQFVCLFVCFHWEAFLPKRLIRCPICLPPPWSRWILGTYKLNVSISTIISDVSLFYYHSSYRNFFCWAFLINGSRIIFVSIFGLLIWSLLPNMWAVSLRCLIFPCSSMSIISFYPTRIDGLFFPSVYGMPSSNSHLLPNLLLFGVIQALLLWAACIASTSTVWERINVILDHIVFCQELDSADIFSGVVLLVNILYNTKQKPSVVIVMCAKMK